MEMKKKMTTNKLLTFMSALVLFLLMGGVVKAEAATEVAHGNCGAHPHFDANSGGCLYDDDSAKWVLDSDGVLTISPGTPGTPAEMGCGTWSRAGYDTASGHVDIQRIVIEDGITAVRKIYNQTTYSSYYPFNCDGANNKFYYEQVTSISIGKDVEEIEAYSFRGCPKITELTFASGSKLKSIGAEAFYGSNSVRVETAISGGATTTIVTSLGTQLTSLVLPEGLETIGNSAFKDSKRLTSITFPSTLKTIGNNTFENCTSLPGISFPDSITTIGKEAFKGCTGFTSITYPKNAVNAGSGIFSNCSNLASVTIPYGTTKIGSSAFLGCSKITGITIASTVTEIGSGAFKNTGLTGITVPGSVATIGSEAFYNTPITSATLGNGVVEIGADAFYNCSGLTDISIPNTVRIVGNGAFNKCTGMKALILPEGVTTIGTNVFKQTGSGTAIFVPKTTTSLAYNFVLATGSSHIGTIYYGGSETEWANLLTASEWSYTPSQITSTVVYDYVPLEKVEFDFDYLYMNKAPNGQVANVVEKLKYTPENATRLFKSSTSSSTYVAGAYGTTISLGHLGRTTLTFVFEVPGGTLEVSKEIQVINCVESITMPTGAADTIVAKGKTKQIKPDLGNATIKKLDWVSADESIATVDGDGNVTGHKCGNVTLTATSTDGTNVSQTCDVEVVVGVERIELNYTEYDIDVSDSLQLTATVYPADAKYKEITWDAHNDVVDYLSVTQNGLVTATGERSDGWLVTASTVEGVKADCKFYIYGKPESAAIKLENGSTPESIELDCIAGAQTVVSAITTPEYWRIKDTEWSSSDENVVKIVPREPAYRYPEDRYITVVGLGEADVTLKAKAANDSFSKTATLHVKVVPIRPTAIGLGIGNLQGYVGTTKQLTATVLPENAYNKNVTWEMLDTNIATVSETGLVTFVGDGNTTLKVTAQGNTSVTASLPVSSRRVRVSSIRSTESQIRISEYEIKQLECIVGPENASDKTWTATSSDQSVAKIVDGKVIGVVDETATGSRSATITFTANDPDPVYGTVKSTATVDVAKAATDVMLNVDTSTTPLSIAQGNTKDISVNNFLPRTGKQNFVWTSSNESIATVAKTTTARSMFSTATITAVSVGECDIIVTNKYAEDRIDGAPAYPTAVCHVKVTPVALNSVTLDPSTTTWVNVNETVKFTPVYNPTNASIKSVEWSFTHPNRAEVDQNGVVTGKSKSDTLETCKVIVKVTDEFGTVKEANTQVKVNTRAVSSIEVSPAEYTLFTGQTVQLSATVLPENATDKSITWSTTDKSNLSVDENGLVTAIKGGSFTYTVKATAKDGSKVSGSCKIQVKDYATGIKLNNSASSISLDLVKGDEQTLTATVLPNTAMQSVTWSSSDPSVAAVDENGKITAKKNGNATITATSQDGKNITNTCAVTVRYANAASVTISKIATTLITGSTETISATVNPENADQSVTWSSSDTSVATVDADGKITAVSAGTATITAASAADNTKTDACTVTVRDLIAVTGVSLNKSSTTLTLGSSETLIATIAPADADNKAVTWTSGNILNATVDSNGKVTARAEGTVTITATTADGGFTATCEVTVKPAPKCGDNLSWTLSGSTITISGSGYMYNYSPTDPAPWNSMRNSITKLVVDTGVKSIGEYAFYNCTYLASVESKGTSASAAGMYGKALAAIDSAFPGLTYTVYAADPYEIGAHAFDNCSSLTSITVPEGATAIRADAFAGCTKLAHVYIPASVTTIDSNAFRGLTGVTIHGVQGSTAETWANSKNGFTFSTGPIPQSLPNTAAEDNTLLHLCIFLALAALTICVWKFGRKRRV